MIKKIYKQGNLVPRILKYLKKRDIKTATDFINMDLERDTLIGDTTLNRMEKIQKDLKYYIS